MERRLIASRIGAQPPHDLSNEICSPPRKWMGKVLTFFCTYYLQDQIRCARVVGLHWHSIILMRCRQPLYSLCLIIYYFTLFTNTVARPSPGSESEDVCIPNLNPFCDKSVHTLPPRPPDTSLTRRSVTDLGGGWQFFLQLNADWNLYYSSWASTSLPIQPAAWALTRLYRNMVDNAGSIWRLSPPRHDLELQVGNVLLSMNCREEPIPWDLVWLFAQKLLDLTEGGWTGIYSLMVRYSQAETLNDPRTEMSVQIILKVVDRLGRSIQP